MNLLLAMLLLAGCSNGSTGGGQQPPPGGGSPHTGRLVAYGNTYVQEINLSGNGSWTDVDPDHPGCCTDYQAIALHLPEQELLIASTTLQGPVMVTAYDLTDYSFRDAWQWPGTAGNRHERIEALAVSPDGVHLAAVFRGHGTFLEIVNTETDEVVYSDNPGLVGTDLAWLDEEWLVVVLALDDPDWEGGIAAANISDLAAGEERIRVAVLTGFTPDDWSQAIPSHFAFSRDKEELVYSWNLDLWVADVDNQPAHSLSQQLTTGPGRLGGAAFSPDGTHIAFTLIVPRGLNYPFAIPNHRNEPLYISAEDPNPFRLGPRTMAERILLWQE